jgi:hypothetical protein
MEEAGGVVTEILSMAAEDPGRAVPVHGPLRKYCRSFGFMTLTRRLDSPQILGGANLLKSMGKLLLQLLLHALHVLLYNKW